MIQKVLIGVIMAMFVFMPVTHYKAYKHGRVTMKADTLKTLDALRVSIRPDGKIHFFKKALPSGACTNCHEGGM